MQLRTPHVLLRMRTRVTWDVLTYPNNIHLHVSRAKHCGHWGDSYQADSPAPCAPAVCWPAPEPAGCVGALQDGPWDYRGHLCVHVYLPEAHALLEQGRRWGTHSHSIGKHFCSGKLGIRPFHNNTRVLRANPHHLLHLLPPTPKSAWPHCLKCRHYSSIPL